MFIDKNTGIAGKDLMKHGCSNLNMEDIANTDYKHDKKVLKNF